ncbi:MAG: hypothetical protein KF910_12300 [Brevundimonas sp.]|uniref:hypothetical protein n=1 Tax=Brevundimonas sp. TaxID=1871086 RepID=UPI0025C33BB3|nr:hypothetical protein [Brevundimonas sp.]MBX3478386.1 hypothetical protein [Brevundimonas sp.]
MRRIDWTWPRGAERGRLPALVAASVALHAVVLGYMALRTFDAPSLPAFEPVRQAIPLDLTPRPLLQGERRRQPAAAVEAPTPALSRTAPASEAAPVAPRSRREEDETPQAPAGRMAAPAPAGAPAPPDGAWQVRRESLGDGVARTLRQGLPGCGMMFDRLSAAEQALCDQRFNAAAGRAAPLAGTGNPERDARFAAEGERELRRYEARRRPLSGGTGVVGPGDCPGSNFGVGCAGAHLPDVQGVDMRQGATTTHNSSQRQR